MLDAFKFRIQISYISSFIHRYLAMEKLRSFYDREIVRHATDDSFTADGQLSRWSNKDLDPVPRAQKKWEMVSRCGFLDRRRVYTEPYPASVHKRCARP